MNELMNKIVGWAVVIYAIMFLAWTGFVIYGYGATVTGHIGSLIVLIAVTTIAARSIGAQSYQEMFRYSLAWGIVVAILDSFFVVPFSGWTIYADWNVWLGYGLVVLVPLFPFFFPRRSSALTQS